MLAKIFCTFFLFLSTQLILGQKYLNGVVQYSGHPVSGVTVYIFGASTCTDNLGRFSLPVKDCKSCVYGKEIKIYTNHTILGFAEHTFTIGNNFECNLTILKNFPSVLITGIVQSELSARALPGIEVKLIGTDVSIESDFTNKFGEFRFLVSKDVIGDRRGVRIQVIDTTGFYRPRYVMPQLFDISSFIVIDMRPPSQHRIIVVDYRMFDVSFSVGDLVSIKADGEISTNIIRRFNGNSPEGFYSNSAKLNSGRYNIVPQINHGALMYRISGENVWKPLGRERDILFEHSGFLEFQINTSKPQKIRGAFKVTLTY